MRATLRGDSFRREAVESWPVKPISILFVLEHLNEMGHTPENCSAEKRMLQSLASVTDAALLSAYITLTMLSCPLFVCVVRVRLSNTHG
jgi:hypothetical protein